MDTLVTNDDTEQATMMQWLVYIESILSEFTVDEILRILTTLGYSSAWYKATDGQRYILSDFYQIPECLDYYASQFIIEFFGGPPTEDSIPQWYTGTLVTWAVDALLYDFVTTNGQFAMPILSEIEDFRTDTEQDEEWEWEDE